MKKQIILKIGSLLLTIVCLASCNKKSYIDSGVFPNNYAGTTLDYLKSRPELFNTLTEIIELADMEDVLEKQGVTFFAPPDVSIKKSIIALNASLYLQGRDTVMTVDEVNPIAWKEFLSMYVFDGNRQLKDYPQLDTLNMDVFSGQGYVAIGGQNMNIGVLYNDVVSNNDQGVEQTVKYAGYRQLYLSSVGVSSSFGGMIHSPVATSDLRTKNGVLHVLNFKQHSFGFSSFSFASRAFNLM